MVKFCFILELTILILLYSLPSSVSEETFSRSAGVLFPIFSLPSKHGIGCFSKEAYDFIDALNSSGQKYWQILPLSESGSDYFSPYYSHSAFAGNPLFIDLDKLIDKGWLTQEDIDKYSFGSDPNNIDYPLVRESKMELLYTAFKNSDIESDHAFKHFEKETEWLSNYAFFISLKNFFENESWDHWKDSIRQRHPRVLAYMKKNLKDNILFNEFIQFQFDLQWQELRQYAKSKGIQIIGDIPMYISYDSADVWAHPELFHLDKKLRANFVAGAPPDSFAVKGQKWGNPLYNWDIQEQNNFSWWMKRLARVFMMYDVLRIDHFRAFESFYAIPSKAADARFGQWEKGPGYRFFEVMKKQLGKHKVILEDLGFLTEEVHELAKKTGWPGMKVIQFAFDESMDSDYLPHKYDKNCVAYTGTHDNDSLLGWYRTLREQEINWVNRYFKLDGLSEEDKMWKIIKVMLESNSNLVIVPLQDYLCYGSESRINNPSIPSNNWKFRIKPGVFIGDLELQKKIYDMTIETGR